MMDLKQRRIKVIEKVLDDAISEEIAIKVGIETKKLMLLRMGNNPMAPKVEHAIQESLAALEIQPLVIDTLQKQLDEEMAA